MRSLTLNLTLLAILKGARVSEESLQSSNLQDHPRITWLLGMQQFNSKGPQSQTNAMHYWEKSPEWNADMLVEAVKAAGVEGRLQDAVQFASLSLQLWPASNEAAVIVAELLNEHEEWEQSLPFWIIAERGAPDDATIQTQYGYALFQYGLINEARQHLEKALFLQPDNYDTNKNYLLFLREYGESEEYKAQLIKVYKLFPEAVIYARWLGELAMEEGRFEDAEVYLSLVFENRPTWKKVAFELEELYAITNQQKQTVLLYQYALQQVPQEPVYHLGLIRALRETGNEQSAQEHLCMLQDSMPNIFSEVIVELDFTVSKCGANR